MIAALKSLIGLAGRADATAEELAPSLPQAEEELDAAHAAMAVAEADYKANLLTDDGAISRRMLDARADAGVRVDRAEALVAALRKRLAEAQAREAEAERVTAYEAARAQAEEARTALAELYPQLARDLVALMQVVAEAEMAVLRANADRPAGVPPIPGVEGSVRDVPGVGERVLSETRVERWVDVGRVLPGPALNAAVHDLGNGRGVRKHSGTTIREPVERRGFTEQRVLPVVLPNACYELARRVSLPGLRANEPAFWEPLPVASPSLVLHEIAGRAVALAAPPPRVEPVTRLVPDPGARPVTLTDADAA